MLQMVHIATGSYVVEVGFMCYFHIRNSGCLCCHIQPHANAIMLFRLSLTSPNLNMQVSSLLGMIS